MTMEQAAAEEGTKICIRINENSSTGTAQDAYFREPERQARSAGRAAE